MCLRSTYVRMLIVRELCQDHHGVDLYNYERVRMWSMVIVVSENYAGPSCSDISAITQIRIHIDKNVFKRTKEVWSA